MASRLNVIIGARGGAAPAQRRTWLTPKERDMAAFEPVLGPGDSEPV